MAIEFLVYFILLQKSPIATFALLFYGTRTKLILQSFPVAYSLRVQQLRCAGYKIVLYCISTS